MKPKPTREEVVKFYLRRAATYGFDYVRKHATSLACEMLRELDATKPRRKERK